MNPNNTAGSTFFHWNAGFFRSLIFDKIDILGAAVFDTGPKKILRRSEDSSAGSYSTVFVSAGRRGLQIELSPNDLKALTSGTYADICRQA